MPGSTAPPFRASFHHVPDLACAAAHGEVRSPRDPRRLVLVFV